MVLSPLQGCAIWVGAHVAQCANESCSDEMTLLQRAKRSNLPVHPDSHSQVDIKLLQKSDGPADDAFQLRGSQEDYDRVMAVPAGDREAEFTAIQSELGSDPRNTRWADDAYQIRGSQEDYDRVMAVPAGDREAEYNAIQCESGLDVACMAPTGCFGTYQAEDAEIHGSGTFQNRGNHNGAQGDAFVDFLHGNDAHVEWSVESCHGGAYSASFRYALSGGNRPLQVLVNGESQVASLNFPATGSWSDWGMATAIVNLEVGSNTIRLAAISSSGANVDSLILAPVPYEAVEAVMSELSPEPVQYEAVESVMSEPVWAETSINYGRRRGPR